MWGRSQESVEFINYDDLDISKINEAVIRRLGEWYLLATNNKAGHAHQDVALKLKNYTDKNNRIEERLDFLIDQFKVLLDSKSFLSGEGIFVKQFKKLFNKIFNLKDDFYVGKNDLIIEKLKTQKSNAIAEQCMHILDNPNAMAKRIEQLNHTKRR